VIGNAVRVIEIAAPKAGKRGPCSLCSRRGGWVTSYARRYETLSGEVLSGGINCGSVGLVTAVLLFGVTQGRGGVAPPVPFACQGTDISSPVW
jgi:hypothetical protein